MLAALGRLVRKEERGRRGWGGGVEHSKKKQQKENWELPQSLMLLVTFTRAKSWFVMGS
jgi:hypothetical protein